MAGISRGSEIKVTKRIRIETGDLVFSRLHTQNGAFAFSQGQYQATGTFVPLRVDETRVDRQFLFWVLHHFVPTLSASDTVGRETYKTSEILELKIPLSSLGEQRRIVARIEELASKIEEARSCREEAKDEANALLTAALVLLLSIPKRIPLNSKKPVPQSLTTFTAILDSLKREFRVSARLTLGTGH